MQPAPPAGDQRAGSGGGAYASARMIAGAAEVVALASDEMLGTAAPYIVGPLSALTHLVTERSVAHETLAPYKALGVTVVQG